MEGWCGEVAPGGLGGWAGGEDAAGDSAGFGAFPCLICEARALASGISASPSTLTEDQIECCERDENGEENRNPVRSKNGFASLEYDDRN